MAWLARKDRWKSVLVIGVVLALLIVVVQQNPTVRSRYAAIFTANAVSQTQEINGAVTYARTKLGTNYEYGEWVLFVREAYVNAGLSSFPTGFSGAVQYWDRYPVDQHKGDPNPPTGALVFWGATGNPWPNPYGHVGISIGGGNVISTGSAPEGDTTLVHIFSIAARNAASGGFYPYLGWMSPPGMNLSENSGAQAAAPGVTSRTRAVTSGSGVQPSGSNSSPNIQGGSTTPIQGSSPDLQNGSSPQGGQSSQVVGSSPSSPSPATTPTPTSREGGEGPGTPPSTPIPPANPNAQPQPQTAPPTYAETAGGVAHTWTNYLNAGGTDGPSIAGGQTVQISCRVTGFKVADGNTAWYRIAQAPWSAQYYVSADAFYNNGHTSGSLQGTPFFDPAVATC